LVPIATDASGTLWHVVLLSVVFWLSTGLLIWVYVGYPAFVALLARAHPFRLRTNGMLPSLTVAIAVHDEAGEIAARIDDVRRQAGPGVDLCEILVGSDGSTDATDSIVGDIATDDRRVRLIAVARGGQTATQAALFEAATGDVVVLTDAETRFEPGCLAAIGEAFRDSRVGCATGRLDWRDQDVTATSANEGLYWRYERAVRTLESRAGMLTAVTGAVLAVRRSSYRPVPATASMDHLLPLYVREQGDLVVYLPQAVATDRPISGLREQFRNRTRTATRGIQANLSMIGRLAPWRRPGAAIAIWSHKLLRWATPWLASIALLTGTAAALGGDEGYLGVPLLALVAVVAALAGQGLASTRRRPPRLLAFARALAVVNVAFLAAWINIVRRRRIEAWHRLEWRPRS
jgi:cellulose synthase/poly-beta-1,6-N-acetylglucosamine synthase-like glycosyltransferase